MKLRYYLLLMILFSLSCSRQPLQYPETRKDITVDNYFGTDVPDPYRWLEDDRSEETMEWVKLQNELTFKYLDNIPYRDKIRNRITELMNFPRMGAPWKEGEYYFYTFNNGLQNQDVYYVKKNLEEDGKVFLDPNLFSEEGTVSLTNFLVS